MSKKIRLGYDILSKRAIETESGVNIDEALRSISSYQKVPGVGSDNHPDVPRPSTKVLYIVKVASAGQPDTYKEWIWTQPSGSLGYWECTGDTTQDLSGYALKSEMSVETVQGDPTKKTIQLKSGLSETVLVEHQDISGKQDVISDLGAIRTGAAAGATAYQKPNTGIPSSDMTATVQTSLSLADSAVQPTDISGKEDISNKVTSVRNTSTATDTAYPSEKAVATALATKQGNLEFDGTYNPSTNKVATESTVADAISGLSGCTVMYTAGTGELHLDFRPANS